VPLVRKPRREEPLAEIVQPADNTRVVTPVPVPQAAARNNRWLLWVAGGAVILAAGGMGVLAMDTPAPRSGALVLPDAADDPTATDGIATAGAQPTIVALAIAAYEAPLVDWASALSLAEDPPESWLTEEYFRDPAAFPEVVEHFEREREFVEGGPRRIGSLDAGIQAFRGALTSPDAPADETSRRFEAGLVDLRTDWNEALRARDDLAVAALEYHEWLSGLGTPVAVVGPDLQHPDDGVLAWAWDGRAELRDLYDKAQAARAAVSARGQEIETRVGLL